MFIRIELKSVIARDYNHNHNINYNQAICHNHYAGSPRREAKVVVCPGPPAKRAPEQK
jgi:hypothetical protein